LVPVAGFDRFCVHQVCSVDRLAASASAGVYATTGGVVVSGLLGSWIGRLLGWWIGGVVGGCVGWLTVSRWWRRVAGRVVVALDRLHGFFSRPRRSSVIHRPC
jgi:hypothetical protein